MYSYNSDGANARTKRFVNGANYTSEENSYKRDSIAIDMLEDRISRAFKLALENDRLKNDEHFLAMKHAHEEMLKQEKKLLDDKTLTAPQREQELQKYQQNFKAAAEQFHESPNSEAFNDALRKSGKVEFATHTQQANQSRQTRSHWEPSKELISHRNQMLDEMQDAKNPQKVMRLDGELSRMSIAFYDKKNQGWSEEEGFGHYRSYEQLSSSEKKELAEMASSQHQKWEELKKEFGGTLPPAFEKEHREHQERYTKMGFGEEYKTGKVADNYPEATKATGADRSTMLAATTLSGLTPSPAQTPAPQDTKKSGAVSI
jgi:hypothetical protein